MATSILLKFLTLKWNISRTIWRIEVGDGSLFSIFHALSSELNFCSDQRFPLSYHGWPLLDTEALNKHCTSMILNHMKLIPYQKTMEYRKYCFLTCSYKVYCWEWKLYQSIPSITIPSPWQPWVKIEQILATRQIFCQRPVPRLSLRAFILINFTLLHHFQDLKSLEYLV